MFMFHAEPMLAPLHQISETAYEDNGIKLFGPDGHKLSNDIEIKIENLIDSDVEKHRASSSKIGYVRRIDNVRARYIEFAKGSLPRSLSLE